MKRLTALILAASVCQIAQAQEPANQPSDPLTRAAVKQATRDAAKNGAIPRGEASPTMHKDPSRSLASRSEVKAEAHGATKAGSIPRGDASVNLGRDTAKSTASRAQVKEETRVAVKSGQIARGEAQGTKQ